MTNKDEAHLRNKKRAARYLDISVATLDRMRRNGTGPRYVRVGTQIRYKPEDLVAFVEACAQNTGGAAA